MIKNYTKKYHIDNKGFSIIELLFYIAIFIVLFLVVVNAIIIMTKAFQETTVNIQITQSSNMMEKMSRAIRQSNGIVSFNTSDITLNTLNEAQVYTPVRFVLSGTDLQFYEDGVLVGNLNSPNISVKNLTFEQITTAVGSGIKIYYRVESNSYSSTRAEDFFDTAMLRGEY